MKTWASRSAFNWWLWGHKTTQKEQIVFSLAMLKGLLWGRRAVWPSVTAWLALRIGRALSCCSGFGSFVKRQKGCLNLCLLWHFPLCADIFLSVPSFRVTLYAEFLPMKARAKCILLIEVSGSILILEGQILWWSHPFHPPAWKSVDFPSCRCSGPLGLCLKCSWQWWWCPHSAGAGSSSSLPSHSCSLLSCVL